MYNVEAIPEIPPNSFENARLFATRTEMLENLFKIENAVVAEIGVARGDLSDFIINKFKPLEYHAFDIFTMHETPIIWGKSSSEIFAGKSQLEFYRSRFSDRQCKIVTNIGDGATNLEAYDDGFFDLIYIDGDHEHDGVCRDAKISLRKVKKGGLLIFNDYVLFLDSHGNSYGVIDAANRLIIENDLKVVGFSLQRHMFCDLAVRV